MPPTNVLICTPSYSGELSTNYVSALCNTIALLTQNKIGCAWGTIVGNCYVTAARDLLAGKFLTSDASHMLFIDADMSWTADAVMKLLKMDKDIAVGAYTTRSDHDRRWTFRTIPGKKLDENGLVEIAGAGTGFMLIKRSVFTDLLNKTVRTVYKSGNPDDGLVHEFFPTKNTGGNWVSEDYVFCDEVRAHGKEIWLDTTIDLHHKGIYWYTADKADMIKKIEDHV